MSSLVTLPCAPVPVTSSRLTPSLAAMLRTSGLENLRRRASRSVSAASLSLDQRRVAGIAGDLLVLLGFGGLLGGGGGRLRSRGGRGSRSDRSRGGLRGFRSGRGGGRRGRSSGGRRSARAAAGLTGFADAGHDLIDGDGLPFLVADLEQGPGGGAGDLGVHLVGRDLEQGLIPLHLVADLDQPAGDGALGDRLPHLRHHDFRSHNLSRISRTSRAYVSKHSFSRLPARGLWR